MARLVARRALSLCAGLAVISVLVFLAFNILPGDPAQMILGTEAEPAAVAALQRELGLDRPMAQRYAQWAGGMVRGDFGRSLTYKEPVAGLLARALPVSLSLGLYAMVLAVAMSVPLGVYAATRRGAFGDLLAVALAQVGVAVPSFWLGILLILGLAVGVNWFPAGQYAPWSQGALPALHYLTLPAVALAVARAAILVRQVRGSVLECLAQDYVRTARAKGLAERAVLYRHALKNALIPTVTVLGLQFGQLLAGAVIIEQVFQLPGIGRMVLLGISQRDLPVVAGAVMVMATGVVLVNTLVDLTYGWLDPRIRT